MFILKFAIELLVLAVLFLMIRKTLFRTFPLLNPEASKQMRNKWRGQRAMFSVVFLSFGVISSIISFWVIYFAFNFLHGIGSFSGVLVISQAALILPSLIIGFYISTLFSKVVYVEFFGVGEYIDFEQNEGLHKGVGKTFARVFSALTLMPAGILLSMQFNVYLKTDGEHIYTKKLLEEEKVYSVTDIVSVGSSNSQSFDIYLANGDLISTVDYSGNLNYFLDNISHR
jgi:hypothetical protein